VHSKGLKFGLYGDSGNYTCEGFAGSLGHEGKRKMHSHQLIAISSKRALLFSLAQDANQLAAWGVDYWKLDGCWLDSSNEVMSAAYTLWSKSLNATGRPIVFSCRYEKRKKKEKESIEGKRK
jgi:alpha-galactosidase